MALEPSDSLAPSDLLAPDGVQAPALVDLAPALDLAPSDTLAPGGIRRTAVQQSLGIFYPEQPLLGDLGCGTYTVYLMNSGLTVTYGELSATQITWNRGYGTQTGQITIPGGECAKELSAIEKWRYEIAIYRSGAGRIASGPITGFEIDDEQSIITFGDVSAWFGKRKIHKNHKYDSPGADLATIFEDYADDALAPDNHMGIQVSTSPTNILSTQTVLGGQHLIASDELGTLSDTGIDWYALDRTVYAGGLVVGANPVATLRDEHFIGKPKVASGDGEANVYGVRGAGAGDGKDPVYAEAQDDQSVSLYGLLEAVDTVDVITKVVDAQVAAANRVALLSPPPLLVTGGILDPRAPITVDHLLPGKLVDLRLSETLKHVVGLYRLSSIQGQVSDGDEQITIEAQPVGSVSFRITKPPSKQFEKAFAKLLRDSQRMRNGSNLRGEVSFGSVIHIGPVTLRATLNPDTGQILVTIEDTLNGGRSTPVAILP